MKIASKDSLTMPKLFHRGYLRLSLLQPGRIDSVPSGDRAREINDYIEKNQLHDCRMLVVDDDASIFKSEIKENVRFIVCDSRTGFPKDIPETNGADSWAGKLKRFLGVGFAKCSPRASQ